MGAYVPKGVRVEPKSKSNIRSAALSYRREIFKTQDHEFLDLKRIELALEKLGTTIIVSGWNELEDREAATSPNNLEMRIREDVYDALHQGDGRARFTICHEIGHLALHDSVALARTNQLDHKPYEDSEWQADTFSAELLMPYENCRKMRSVVEIQEAYGVSWQAANNRFNDTRN